jgi:hypothetical protein
MSLQSMFEKAGLLEDGTTEGEVIEDEPGCAFEI